MDEQDLVAEKQLRSLLFECFFSKDFKKTHNSFYLGLGLTISTYSYYRFFAYFHPLKNVVIASVLLASTFNSLYTYSKELYRICDSNTPLGSKLRLYHQRASYSNVFIPYFKHETLKAANSKDSSNKTS